MGDMADFETERMERGQTFVRDTVTGKEFWINNTELMYGNEYDSPRYLLLDIGEL